MAVVGAPIEDLPRLEATGPVARRQRISRLSRYVLMAASLIGVAALIWLIGETLREGCDRLSWDFLTNYPSRFPEKAGLRSSIIGSIGSGRRGWSIRMRRPMVAGSFPC